MPEVKGTCFGCRWCSKTFDVDFQTGHAFRYCQRMSYADKPLRIAVFENDYCSRFEDVNRKEGDSVCPERNR